MSFKVPSLPKQANAGLKPKKANLAHVNTARKSSTHAAGVQKLIVGHTKATPKPLASK